MDLPFTSVVEKDVSEYLERMIDCGRPVLREARLVTSSNGRPQEPSTQGPTEIFVILPGLSMQQNSQLPFEDSAVADLRAAPLDIYIYALRVAA